MALTAAALVKHAPYTSVALKEHQKTATARILERFLTTMCSTKPGIHGAVLSLQTGLGKTHICLAALKAIVGSISLADVYPEHGHWMSSINSSSVLVVVPVNVIKGWEEGIGASIHTKRVVVMHGTRRLTNADMQSIGRGECVIVTTQETIRSQQKAFFEVAQDFGVMIVDEAHKYKWPSRATVSMAGIVQMRRSRERPIFVLLASATPIGNDSSKCLASLLRMISGHILHWDMDYIREICAASDNTVLSQLQRAVFVSAMGLESLLPGLETCRVNIPIYDSKLLAEHVACAETYQRVARQLSDEHMLPEVRTSLQHRLYGVLSAMVSMLYGAPQFVKAAEQFIAEHVSAQGSHLKKGTSLSRKRAREPDSASDEEDRDREDRSREDGFREDSVYGVLVVSSRREVLSRLYRMLAKRSFVVEMINGSVPATKRDDIVRRASNGEVQVVLMTEGCGTALTLSPGIRDVIVLGTTGYSPAAAMQAANRTRRLNATAPTVHMYTLQAALGDDGPTEDEPPQLWETIHHALYKSHVSILQQTARVVGPAWFPEDGDDFDASDPKPEPEPEPEPDPEPDPDPEPEPKPALAPEPAPAPDRKKVRKTSKRKAAPCGTMDMKTVSGLLTPTKLDSSAILYYVAPTS
jgi:hypothetical protein